MSDYKRRVWQATNDGAHAAQPGTGPKGETCGTCRHCAFIDGPRQVYRKCSLMREHWTRGQATDVGTKDPACERWSAATPNTPKVKGWE